CIVDFESYPKFLKEMKSAKVIWCEDSQMDVTFKLNLIKEITYTLRFELDPPHSIQWQLKAGELMKKNSGSWKLETLEEGLTDATYSIDVEFGVWIPKAISQTLIEKSLPQTLKAFKRRAERLLRYDARNDS
ncbi:MAG: SRPBCC family protein, partial [Deltaproteobacteria bacterium]|nr:SRPBCC family protein [Deltaproteobacteria bacterium]